MLGQRPGHTFRLRRGGETPALQRRDQPRRRPRQLFTIAASVGCKRRGFGHSASTGRWSRPESVLASQSPADYDKDAVESISARAARQTSVSRHRAPGSPDPVGFAGRSERFAWLPEPQDEDAGDALKRSSGIAALVSRRRPPGDALLEAMRRAQSATPTSVVSPRKTRPPAQRSPPGAGRFGMTARFEAKESETPGPGHYDPPLAADLPETPAFDFGAEQPRWRDASNVAPPLTLEVSDLHVESRLFP